MRRVSIPGILLFTLAAMAYGQATIVEIPRAISSAEQFTAFRDQTATNPEGAVAVFVLAMILRTQDPGLGHDALVIALDAGELRSDATGYRGFTLGNRASEFVRRYLDPAPYLARSYVLETVPAEAYELPDIWQIGITRNRVSVISDDRVRVFVASSGADSPRPVTLQRNNRGIWKAYEYSSLFVGVRPPEQESDDPL
jgi:hypothetical protein